MELIYFPLLPVWIYYSLRSGSLFFFTASNPSIKFGGMGMESKFDIYSKLKPANIPKTIFIQSETANEELLNQFRESGISFPCIVKPDIGMKGLGVEKIQTEKALCDYSNRIQQHFLIQEFIDYINEIGVFYVRIPGSTKGKITGIVHKDFLHVIGDGKHTLEQLIGNTPRSAFHSSSLKKTFADRMSEIIQKGEKVTLVPFGSHTRGARFSDYSHQIDEQIESLIDKISSDYQDFYYGRLDIMYKEWEQFKSDQEWKIIELNGAGSEPTHMYDPEHSLLFAMKEITRHWRLLFHVSVANRKLGHSYSRFSEGWKMIMQSRQLEKHLKKITG
jgi:hypothetical protein